MTKKRQRERTKPSGGVTKVVAEVKPKRYTPPPCTSCTAIRPANKDFTSVYAVRREFNYTVRYCKCGFCGNTFQDYERQN